MKIAMPNDNFQIHNVSSSDDGTLYALVEFNSPPPKKINQEGEEMEENVDISISCTVVELQIIDSNLRFSNPSIKRAGSGSDIGFSTSVSATSSTSPSPLPSKEQLPKPQQQVVRFVNLACLCTVKPDACCKLQGCLSKFCDYRFRKF